MTGLRVQRRQCATCIYRPDSPLDLRKLEADCADKFMPGYFAKHRTCHHSRDAVCAGFWRRHRDKFTAGQIAQRLNLVTFVQDDILRKGAKR